MSVRNKLIRFFAATILVGRAAAFFLLKTHLEQYIFHSIFLSDDI